MKQNIFRNTVIFFTNVGYFLLVLFFALALATLALTRKLNSVDTSRYILLLTVSKEQEQISNSVVGRVDKVNVQPGQSVKKGDVLIEMSDAATAAKLKTLQRVTDNVSAQTEASVLKSQLSQYKIIASKDGVIYKIMVSEGSYLSTQMPVIELFSNGNTKLLSQVTALQYADLQKQVKLNAYSSRLEQLYNIELEGVSKVLAIDEKTGEPRYEISFHFTNPEDGNSFIQGENMDVVSRSRDDEMFKPAYIIAKFWNSFIIGK